jgi:hypothetical protein
MSKLTDRLRRENHEASLAWLSAVEVTADQLLSKAESYQKTLFQFYVSADQEEQRAMLARSDEVKIKLRQIHAALSAGFGMHSQHPIKE